MDSWSSHLCCSRVNCLCLCLPSLLGATGIYHLTTYLELFHLTSEVLPLDSYFNLFKDVTPWLWGFPLSHNDIGFPVQLVTWLLFQKTSSFHWNPLKSTDDIFSINQTHRPDQSMSNNDMTSKIFTKQGIHVRSPQMSHNVAKLQSGFTHHCSENYINPSFSLKGSCTGNIPLGQEPCKCFPVLQAMKHNRELLSPDSREHIHKA